MIRWLVLILIAILIYHALEYGWRRLTGGQSVGKASSEGSRDELVACESCGLRLPAGRTLNAGGHVYCSPECRSRRAS